MRIIEERTEQNMDQDKEMNSAMICGLCRLGLGRGNQSYNQVASLGLSLVLLLSF